MHETWFVFTTWYGHLYFSGCTKRGVCRHILIWSPLFFRMHETWGLSSPPDHGHLYFSGCTRRGVCLHHLIWCILNFSGCTKRGVCLHHLIWSTFIFQDARNVEFDFTTWYGHLYFSGCTIRGVCLHHLKWWPYQVVKTNHLIWSPLFFVSCILKNKGDHIRWWRQTARLVHPEK